MEVDGCRRDYASLLQPGGHRQLLFLNADPEIKSQTMTDVPSVLHEQRMLVAVSVVETRRRQDGRKVLYLNIAVLTSTDPPFR